MSWFIETSVELFLLSLIIIALYTGGPRKCAILMHGIVYLHINTLRFIWKTLMFSINSTWNVDQLVAKTSLWLIPYRENSLSMIILFIFLLYRHAGFQLPVHQLLWDHSGAQLWQVPSCVIFTQRMAGQPRGTDFIHWAGQKVQKLHRALSSTALSQWTSHSNKRVQACPRHASRASWLWYTFGKMAVT